jgi:hypothetical protein
VDKAKLLNQSGLRQEEVEIEGLDEPITVRALSRHEIMLAGKMTGDDALEMEQLMLSWAMVDPKLTKKEVELWQKNSPLGQMQAVILKVNELSGVGEGVQKAAYKSLREDSES